MIILCIINLSHTALLSYHREGICKCGYPKDHHVEEANNPERFLGQSWEGQSHVIEVPTDAFGDIHFGGLAQNTGKVNVFACFSLWFVYFIVLMCPYHARIKILV